MKTKNLSELSERELENNEKVMKISFYFISTVGIICTLVVIISSYIYVPEQPTSWWTWTFVTFIPLYMAFKAKKKLYNIKAEFERRRCN